MRLVLRGRLNRRESSGFRSLRHGSRTVRLNASAAAILELCDGTRTPEDIIDSLSDPPPDQHLARMVREFLEAALRSAWIVESDRGDGKDTAGAVGAAGAQPPPAHVGPS